MIIETLKNYWDVLPFCVVIPSIMSFVFYKFWPRNSKEIAHSFKDILRSLVELIWQLGALVTPFALLIFKPHEVGKGYPIDAGWHIVIGMLLAVASYKLVQRWVSGRFD